MMMHVLEVSKNTAVWLEHRILHEALEGMYLYRDIEVTPRGSLEVQGHRIKSPQSWIEFIIVQIAALQVHVDR